MNLLSLQALQTDFPCSIVVDVFPLRILKHANHYGNNIRKQKKRIICMQQKGTLCRIEFCKDAKDGKAHIQNQVQ